MGHDHIRLHKADRSICTVVLEDVHSSKATMQVLNNECMNIVGIMQCLRTSRFHAQGKTT